MAKDFRTNQIRAIKIIGSGGIDPTKPNLGLLIYSSSDASNYDGGLESAFNNHVTNNIGNDVWMAVGGTRNTSGLTRADGSSVLFVGDVVVSGTLWAERSVIEVDNTVAGDFIAPNKAILGVNQSAASNKISDGYARILVDPTTTNNSPAPGRHDSGTVSFNMVQGNVGVYTYDGTLKTDVFFHVSGSRGVRGTNDRGLALFDGDLHTSGNFSMSPASVWTTDIILDNSTDDPPILAQQNGFGNRWTTLEVEVSSLGEHNVVLANSGSSASDGIKFKVLAGVPNDEQAVVISGSGDFAIDPGKKVYFDSVRQTYIGSSDPGDGSQRWRFEGASDGHASLWVNKAVITGSGGLYFPRSDTNAGRQGQAYGIAFLGAGGAGQTTAGLFYNSNADGLTINPVLGGPPDSLVLTNSNSGHKLEIGAENIYMKGMAGVSIEASDPARDDPHGGPIHLYATGSGITMHGSVVINDNLTVHGDSIIAHVKTMTIEDPLILLNSGALDPNTGGGIAIASGSSFTDQSLVFGRSDSYNNTFIAGRLDVQDGHVTSFGGAVPLDIQAAGYRFGNWPQHVITASADQMVFSASRFAFETGRGLFFNDIGGTVGMDDGAVFINYNNGIYPGPRDLHIGVGSGSLVVAADSMEPTFLYLGGGSPGITRGKTKRPPILKERTVAVRIL